MEELIKLLKEKHLTIGSCESLTAGLFSASIASIPGASSVLKGGIVTYQTSVKETLVGVDKEVIAQEGVISIACAKEMAQKTRVLLDSDICVSFSGNAGPTMMEQKPAGYVCCAVAFKKDVFTYDFQFSGTRNEVRVQVVNTMIKKIIDILIDEKE